MPARQLGPNWTHVSGPDDDECRALASDLGIPYDWIRDSLDEFQRARFQRQGDLALVIVLCPRTVPARPEPFATVPLGIVLGNGRATTICRREPDVIDDAERSPPDAAAPGPFLRALLYGNADVFRRELVEIHRRSTFEEEGLKRSITGERLEELINQGRSLAYFTSALDSDLKMLDVLGQDGLGREGPDGGPAFDEVVERYSECAEVAAVFVKVHAGLMEGWSALVSMNLNALVRTLTEITIALAIPALIAAMWGMNLGLPLEDHELAFVLLTLLIVALGIAAFLVIRFGERFGLRLVGRS